MAMLNSIKVFAPASIGNVSCGFDVLGLALNQPGDEVCLTRNNLNKLRITTITGDGGLLPTEVSKNTAGIAVQSFLQAIGQLDTGVDIELHKQMPIGSGTWIECSKCRSGRISY